MPSPGRVGIFSTNINKDIARDIVRKTLSQEQIKRSMIYWSSQVIKSGEEIKIGPQKFTMPFEGTMVFVDLAPYANWAHPCLYLFINGKTLNTKVIEASFPPDIEQTDKNYIVILRFGEKAKHEHIKSVFEGNEPAMKGKLK